MAAVEVEEDMAAAAAAAVEEEEEEEAERRGVSLVASTGMGDSLPPARALPASSATYRPAAPAEPTQLERAA